MLLLLCPLVAANGSTEDVIDLALDVSDKAHTFNEPIRIDGDLDLASQAHERGWLGNGTTESPYVIENQDIYGATHGYCIYIGNTTCHFSVSNSTLNGASGHSDHPYSRDSGLMLYNVMFGSVFNCSFSDNGHGIYLYDSGNIVIANSIISDNDKGIFAQSSSPCVIDCDLDGNEYGIYDMNGVRNEKTSKFVSGSDRELATLINGAVQEEYGITLPSLSVPRSVSMTVEGLGIRNVPVTEDPYFQLSPSIHDDLMVWQDKRDGNWEIYGYNLSLDSDGNGVPNYLETVKPENDPALLRITQDPSIQYEPDVWEDVIVWTDLRTGGFDIYAYCLSNDTEWAVTDHPSCQWKPAVYGDHIVWSDKRNGNYDIYMFNISDGEMTRLSTSDWEDLSPEIEDDRVVWYSYSGSPGGPEYSDIYMFNIDTWTLEKINKDDPLQYSPSIHKGSVVWHDNRHGNWEIYHYDIDTHVEQRITDEKEQNFCARMYGDNIVYYFHDRVQDIWSVRMYDMGVGKQSIIEARTFGDSHPVIFGSRIAWVNKSQTRNDLYVLDLSISGLPQDVTVDIGSDGDNEFQWQGALDGVADMDQSAFLNELAAFVPGTWNDTVEIPIRVGGNGSGRIGLGSLSIIYDLPTFVMGSRIANCSECAIYCNVSGPRIINSTLVDNLVDIHMGPESFPVLLNTHFFESRLLFTDETASLTIQNYLHIKAENLNGEPLNATTLVTDDGKTVFNGTVDDAGTVQWLVITDAVHNSTGKHQNETIVTMLASFLFNRNPRTVDMTSSHWEVFSTDVTAPEVSDRFPLADWMFNRLDPVISVIITDHSDVDLSSARLYVRNTSVAYDATPVPGGFNISYYHIPGFSDGDVIQCRVTAEDIHGNTVDNSWSFVIDLDAEFLAIPLQAGWNLVSIPFEPVNSSFRSVLGSITGQYDQIMLHNTSDTSDPWKSFSIYRPSILNDLVELGNDMGFWVHATENCTLLVSGISPEITHIPLHAGWNLVSLPTLNNNVTLEVAFSGTGMDRVEGPDAMSPYYLKELPTTYVMRPGEGYWVHVPADTTWTVDW